MDITGNAFVVGGGGGIGRACVLGFAKHGARGVMVADLDLEAAQKAATESKGVATNPEYRVEVVHVDVTSEASVKTATENMVQSFGRIDYCVNSAGINASHSREIAEASVQDFGHLFNVNATGTFLVTSAVSAAMKSQDPVSHTQAERGSSRGSIVNLGSAASFIPIPQRVQYTASKHAVLGVTKNAAIDNVRHGIRVNCVCPSFVDTALAERASADFAFTKFLETIMPMRRMALPGEVADTVIFLSSPLASYITGASLIVDGGVTITCHT
ncbi:NAD(P)-binding protein [Xylariomycetidae sp. FL2044]|nr:NAD(P)-binding protein [Xylariomycetidae sp. FL2044]